MNVLLTCAGRCSHSIAVFRAALGGRGNVLACDCSADAPALQEADLAFVVPHVSEPNYLAVLLAICEAHQVGLLIPALEPELLLLALHRARFTAIGTLPLVSAPAIIATCFDKIAAARFLAGFGLLAPQTFFSLAEVRAALHRQEVTFPLVVKPRWGVNSIATATAEDDEELELSYKVARKRIARSFLAGVSATDPDRSILIQECLSGTEYGLDVINDLQGNYVCTFITRKLRLRDGLTDRAVTVKDHRLEMLGALIGRGLGHVGILDCDLFLTELGCCVIDLNPRLGRNYPFLHLAGANYPAALIAWASGEEPDPGWFEIAPQVAASRCDDFVILNRQAVQRPLLRAGGIPA